jgi:hypothetical protein
MLKRTTFKRTEIARPSRAPLVLQATPSRAVMRKADGNARLTVMPKSKPIQHEGYMALVRLLPCDHCGREGPSQFCHSDEGKGGAIKSDCRFGWPGCGPYMHQGVMFPGCHYLIGTQRIYPKEQRRRYEAEASHRTRTRIEAQGLWPAGLERIEQPMEKPWDTT